MPSEKDSLANTFKVAVLLSLACSVVVSVFAVGLKGFQDANKERFRKQNILKAAANLIDPEGEIDLGNVDNLYAERIEAVFVDLETGKERSEIPDPVNRGETLTPDEYDAKKAAKDPAYTVEIAKKDDIAGLQGKREKYAVVYKVLGGENGETVIGYVLPIRGYGLWSTLWGFIALDAKDETIRGITYYEHAETPGLGGEVDNEGWKASWVGKHAFDDEGNVVIEVVKGQASTAPGPDDEQVDGLAGATITSRGVTNMLRYWLGDQGYGPYLKKTQDSPEDADPSKTADATPAKEDRADG